MVSKPMFPQLKNPKSDSLRVRNVSDKLSQLLNINYQKNAKGIYDLLLQKQQGAIRNAEKLLSKYEILNPENNNPSTTVHLLVRELNKWLNG